jgi:predicted  nucleic acid-binding Zn-ribbon protein
MVERKEPTLTGIGAGVNPDHDELQALRPNNGAGATPSGKSNKAAPTAARPAAARVVTKSSPLAPFALLLALTGLGLAGFVYWQFMQTQQQLIAADARLLELEKKLELSDDESSQSVTALRAKLKWADSEIRKLWGVAHDRNRKAIADNKNKVAKLEKSLASVKNTSSAAKKLADGQAKTLAAVKAETKTLAGQSSKAVSDAAAAQKQLRELVDKANRIDQQLVNLKSDLLTRVKDNEEAIEAIDAYRRTINRDILQLKQKHTQAPAPAPAQ